MEQPGYNKTGMASWYGPNFHGRLTANGEVYDQYSLSAAHPTLPLPSYARVTNLENGSSVIVRINDRGPFSERRIIDLSAQASKMLGYQKQGLTKVRVRYLGKARMDGFDARYLMASYSPARGKGIFKRLRIFNPGATESGTMIAGIAAPAPRRVFNNTAQSRLTNSDAQKENIILSGYIPLPVMRPTLLYQGSFLNLASSNSAEFGRLKPLGYLNSINYDERINQAFSVIDKLGSGLIN
jgi:rare lipoprotein A (peptidoglycan hydrolase)